MAQSNASSGVYESSASMFLNLHVDYCSIMFLNNYLWANHLSTLTNGLHIFVSFLKASKVFGRGCIFPPIYYVCQLLFL